MNYISDPNVTQDERTFATLAHALQTVGWWIAPLVIFLVKRESKFVKFHALQALLLQCCFVVLWMLVMTVMFTTMLTSFASNPNPQAPPLAIIVMFPVIWLAMMGGWVLMIVLTVLFSIKAGRGQWARYPLLGGLAMRILGISRAVDEPLSPLAAP